MGKPNKQKMDKTQQWVDCVVKLNGKQTKGVAEKKADGVIRRLRCVVDSLRHLEDQIIGSEHPIDFSYWGDGNPSVNTSGHVTKAFY